MDVCRVSHTHDDVMALHCLLLLLLLLCLLNTRYTGIRNNVVVVSLWRSFMTTELGGPLTIWEKGSLGW